MKTFLFTIFASISILGCAQKNSNANSTIKISRNIESFQGIKSEGSFYVTVVNAPQNGKISLEGNEEDLAKIITEVDQNGTLIIKTKKLEKIKGNKRKTINNGFNSKINIVVNAQNLKSAGLSGSGNLILEGTQNVDSFQALLSGSGDINVDVNTKQMHIAISGSGDIKATGKTDNLKVAVSGSGDVSATDLTAKNAEVSIAGSGDVRIMATEEISGAIVGSGDIYYKGKPASVKVRSAGSGDIREL